jgi:hypothetical protein
MLQQGILAIGTTALIAALAWWGGEAGHADRAPTGPAVAAWPPSAAPQPVRTSPVTDPPQRTEPALVWRPAPAGLAPVTVLTTSPQTLQLGEQNDLVVSVGPHATAAEVGFTAHFDPNVLQARSGAEGDWTTTVAGAGADFEADIPESSDQARIRSTVTARQPRAMGGTVAIVQFQAVAPGATTIRITDVMVKDAAGNLLPVQLSSPTLHVTAHMPPMAWPATSRPQGEQPVQPIDGDD